MEVWETLAAIPPAYQRGVMALGTFDGLHLGHQQVIRRALAWAARESRPGLVVTFRNHPLSVLAPERAPRCIETAEARREVLERLGVDFLVELDFTRALASMTAGDFLRFLAETAAPQGLVVGENYSFGAGREGTPAYLREAAAHYGFRVEVCPLTVIDGQVVSSTRIRALLARGDLKTVNDLLGRPFAVSGEVQHGDARGHLLGFPTANLSLDRDRAMLPDGAYAVRARFKGHDRFGIANIGSNPTFDGKESRLEIHLFDYAGDLYGVRLKVVFIERLREERHFGSADELRRQLCDDERRARRIFHLQ